MSVKKQTDLAGKSLPESFSQGEFARLFPTIADTNREQRLTSIFLALLPHLPVLAKDLFSSIQFSVGERTKIECWTEVVPNHREHSDNRPDGLIVIKKGKTTWSALIETKVKKKIIDEEQVIKYLETAKALNIDAVITISNQFVTRPQHSPVNFKNKRKLPKKVYLFHWSWTYIQTRCEILSRTDMDDPKQFFLLSEFLRFLDHKDTGIESFSMMNQGWKELVQTVANQGVLSKTSQDVEECVGYWYQEERDLSLQLSRHVSAKVDTVMPAKFTTDQAGRLTDGISRLIEEKTLYSAFRIPNCAANLEVCVHLMARTVTYSMKIKARLDRTTTRGRVNWLLGMLPDDDPRLYVRAHWPGRTQPTDKQIAELRDNPGGIQIEKTEAVPHSFEVLLVISNLGTAFSGRQKFIEILEVNLTQFYDLVGQNLRTWHAPPPKPVGSSDTNSKVEETTASDSNTTSTIASSENMIDDRS